MNDPLAPPPIVRNPDTVFLLGMVLLAGLNQLLRDDANPSNSARIVGDVVANAWAMSLAVTAALCIVGISTVDRILGWFLELIGRVVLMGSCLAYASLFVTSPAGQFNLSVALVLGLAMSSGWRIIQIIKDLKKQRRVVNILLEEQGQGDS